MTQGDIIQEAMDLIDEPQNEASGRFSLAWWSRRLNGAQRYVARKTGYKLTRHAVAVTAYTQTVALPASLCWGIISVHLGTTLVESLTVDEAESNYAGWRYQSDFANQGTINGIEVLSSEVADTTQTLTLKGLTTAGVYVTEDIALTGTTQANSVTTTYGELWYAELDAECTGTVTIRKAVGDATITTIAAGELTSGTDIPSAKPLNYVFSRPNIEWICPPDANYTAFIRGGSLPADFSTSITTLAGATATPDSMPGEWHDLLSLFTAALAQTADLDGDKAAGRLTVLGQSAFGQLDAFEAYLNTLCRDRASAIPVDTDWYS